MNPPPKPISLDEPAVRTPESIPDADSFTNFVIYINAELMLTIEGEGMVAARVIKRSLGPEGNAVGAFNQKKIWIQGYMISCLWTGRFNSYLPT